MTKFIDLLLILKCSTIVDSEAKKAESLALFPFITNLHSNFLWLS